MATSENTLAKVLGLVLVVGGAGLAFWGYQMSGSLAAQFSKTLTGALPDAVMYRYIGGAVSCVAGLFLLVKKGCWTLLLFSFFAFFIGLFFFHRFSRCFFIRLLAVHSLAHNFSPSLPRLEFLARHITEFHLSTPGKPGTLPILPPSFPVGIYR